MQIPNQTTDSLLAQTSAPTPPTPANEGLAYTNSAEGTTPASRAGDISSASVPRLQFDADSLVPKSMCVGWIDIMGSKNAMHHSLKTAANFVAKFHIDIEHEKKKIFSERNPPPAVISLMDGAYVVSENIGDVLALVRQTIRRCAIRFFKETIPVRRSMVRAAISWGNVVEGADLKQCVDKPNLINANRLDTVMVGPPFASSNADEHYAPPFGIFIDGTVREATQNHPIVIPNCKRLANIATKGELQPPFSTVIGSPQSIAWILDKWWCETEEKTNYSVPAKLVLSLDRQLKWLLAHPVESGLPEEKTKNYQKLIAEYFSAFHVHIKTKSNSFHRQSERVGKNGPHPTRSRRQRPEKAFGKHNARNDRQLHQGRNGRSAFRN